MFRAEKIEKAIKAIEPRSTLVESWRHVTEVCETPCSLRRRATARIGSATCGPIESRLRLLLLAA